VPVIALMVVKGCTWSNLNLFWLDLAWAPAVGCLLAVFELPFQRRCRPGCGSCDQQVRLSSPGTGGR
jgi:hypothetical protein